MPTQQDPGTEYPSIQNFYSRQMHLLDDGKVDEWAATFTEDGSFGANAHPAPFVGRTAIADGARKAHAALAERGVQRRHWLGMLAAEPRTEGGYRVRSYAQILETPRGGQTTVLMSTTCDDVLVRTSEGEWRVQSRAVRRDDLA
ncbi:nuclear transport factor 2 family protein [Amycolatopsis sp. NPDC003676]